LKDYCILNRIEQELVQFLEIWVGHFAFAMQIELEVIASYTKIGGFIRNRKPARISVAGLFFEQRIE
jgi:hypothetical protein